jgi:hypothetical protein
MQIDWEAFVKVLAKRGVIVELEQTSLDIDVTSFGATPVQLLPAGGKYVTRLTLEADQDVMPRILDVLLQNFEEDELWP